MNEGQMKIGINGLGRIGKLTLWHHAGRRYFNEIVVNIGRQAGTGLADIAHYLERDSTYGALHTYLHGYQAQPVISDIDEKALYKRDPYTSAPGVKPYLAAISGTRAAASSPLRLMRWA